MGKWHEAISLDWESNSESSKLTQYCVGDKGTNDIWNLCGWCLYLIVEVSRKQCLSSRNIQEMNWIFRYWTMNRSQLGNWSDIDWGPMNIYICSQSNHLLTASALKTSLHYRILTQSPKRPYAHRKFSCIAVLRVTPQPSISRYMDCLHPSVNTHIPSLPSATVLWLITPACSPQTL